MKQIGEPAVMGVGCAPMLGVATRSMKGEWKMNEPRTPTTLPSPVDRGGFRFVAVNASRVVWRWVDEDMAWVRDPYDVPTDLEDVGSRSTMH